MVKLMFYTIRNKEINDFEREINEYLLYLYYKGYKINYFKIAVVKDVFICFTKASHMSTVEKVALSMEINNMEKQKDPILEKVEEIRLRIVKQLEERGYMKDGKPL
jgi:hypothetical protein